MRREEESREKTIKGRRIDRKEKEGEGGRKRKRKREDRREEEERREQGESTSIPTLEPPSGPCRAGLLPGERPQRTELSMFLRIWPGSAKAAPRDAVVSAGGVQRCRGARGRNLWGVADLNPSADPF